MLSIMCVTAILALGALSATAAPASKAVNLAVIGPRQASLQVLACEHPNFQGSCATWTGNRSTCYNVPASWNDKISSINNLSRNTFHCIWFENGGCTGASCDNQEDSSLSDGGAGWDDRISSLRCS